MKKYRNPGDYLLGAVFLGVVTLVVAAGCGTSSESPTGETNGVHSLKVEFGSTWRDCVRLYDHDLECDFTKIATAP